MYGSNLQNVNVCAPQNITNAMHTWIQMFESYSKATLFTHLDDSIPFIIFEYKTTKNTFLGCFFCFKNKKREPKLKQSQPRKILGGKCSIVLSGVNRRRTAMQPSVASSTPSGLQWWTPPSVIATSAGTSPSIVPIRTD